MSPTSPGRIGTSQKFFDVTTQEGPILKYLNLCFVQSSYGISFDQTEHIHDMILNLWLKELSEYVKGSHTPCEQIKWPNEKSANQWQLILKNSRLLNMNLEAHMQLSMESICISWFGLILNCDVQQCAMHAILQTPPGSCLTASTV